MSEILKYLINGNPLATVAAVIIAVIWRGEWLPQEFSLTFIALLTLVLIHIAIQPKNPHDSYKTKNLKSRKCKNRRKKSH